MSDLQKHRIPPSYMLGVRAFKNAGHKNTTAIGDLIDNSIDAQATTINIRLGQKDNNQYILVADNGCGMNEKTLLEALTAGEHNDSKVGTIGHFGMGLKTSAFHFGNCLEVITKMENGPMLKAIFDLELMSQDKDWSVMAGMASTEDITLFNEVVNDDQGTIIRITNLDRKDNVGNLTTAFKSYIGRTFRYFLKPIEVKDEVNVGKKLQIFINDAEVFGLDPLERQAPNTQTFGVDITFGDKRICQAIVSYLSDKDSGPNNSKDSGKLNFVANQTNQGIYVVRENREILAGDTTTFQHVWGRSHDHKNYCRIELRYSNMDDIFRVNFTKHGIQDMSQSVLDILERELGPYISQATRLTSMRDTNRRETDELKNYHDAASQIISSKANVLDLPTATKQKRNRTKTPLNPGSRKPTGLGKPKNGKHSSTNPLQKVKFETGADGTAKPLFTFRTEKNMFVVRWNIDHDFYRKYVSSDETKTHVCAVNFMAFVLASVLERKGREQQPADHDEQFDANDFISLISSDLSALAK